MLQLVSYVVEYIVVAESEHREEFSGYSEVPQGSVPGLFLCSNDLSMILLNTLVGKVNNSTFLAEISIPSDRVFTVYFRDLARIVD